MRQLPMDIAAPTLSAADDSRATGTPQAAPWRRVAVVTRTRNRPLLLRRAAQSVSSQTFKDFLWVVVNDGGDAETVRSIVEGAGLERDNILLVSLSQSRGMEAASNAGIAASQSDFVVIHDDDDSWAPDFLEKTVAFLSGPQGQRYGGVITHSIHVSEDIRDGEVIERRRRPFQTSVRDVQLSQMLRGNFFPPISFLFRRSIWEEIGGFNEDLPVLGDWFFNLEFLLKADIGVLPEPLAFYHHRDQASAGTAYANSVVAAGHRHSELAAVVRNTFLRRHIDKSAVALSLVLSQLDDLRRDEPVVDQAAAEGPAGASPVGAPVDADRADLDWVIGSVNRHLARRTLGSFVRSLRVRPLEADAGWNQAVEALKKLGAPIPIPDHFDETSYLAANPDVADAVQKGQLQSGYQHFLLFGRFEGRHRPGRFIVPSAEPREIARPAPSPSTNVLKPVFDTPAMLRAAHRIAGFERVLHVAHHEWHGIRQATAYCPGHKLLIPADVPLEETDKAQIAEEIQALGITHVVFQGYSENADQLLLALRARFGSGLHCYAVTHVTTAQFEHFYEMVMQTRLLIRLRMGTLQGLGSVKPDFSSVIEGYWPGLIINFAPDLPASGARQPPEIRSVYTPLDPGWRKNMYTNVLGALGASNVELVKTANFPNGLESLVNLDRLRLVGYLRGRDLLDEMARSSLVLMATLAECQPMTQLESFAVGTPAMTGPLYIREFEDDPLIRLCTTLHLDNPALLARDVERLVALRHDDPAAMEEMIANHLSRRHALAAERYADFLGL